jgi:RNA polymerase-binding protein DksA
MPGAAGKKSVARRTAKAPSKATKKSTAKKSTTKKSAKKPVARKPVARKPVARKPVERASKRPPAKKSAQSTKKPLAKRKPSDKAKPVAKPVVKKAAAAKPAPSLAKLAPAPAPRKKGAVICPLSGFEVTPSPPNLSPKTLERLRHKLQQEKERLHHQAEDLAAEAEQLARDREAGDTQFDEESGEGDTVNIERERDLLLSASARQVVEEIDDALDRMRKGTYGVCKPAGRRISLERLEAIPWAQVCVDCKARAERRR